MAQNPEQPPKKPDRIIESCPKPAPTTALGHIQQATGTIASPEEAAEVIRATLGVDMPHNHSPATLDLDSKDFYCIIHLARWSDQTGTAGPGSPENPSPRNSNPPNPSPPPPNPPICGQPSTNPPAANQPVVSPITNPQPNPTPNTGPANTTGNASEGPDSAETVKHSNWYVYRGGDHSLRDFNNHNRLFGAKRIWFLFLHLNKDPNIDYNFAYEVFVERQVPTQVQHLIDAFTLFATVTRAPGAANVRQSVYAGAFFDQDYTTSKITINPKVIEVNRGNCQAQNRCECTTIAALGETKVIGNGATFDNEGLSWWDVSIGVPIRRMSQVEFESTANTVTATEVDKQNLFAFLNLFVPRVDIKEGDFGWLPHFVGGISIAKQPLHKYLLGAGWGPKFLQFYVGLLRTKEMQPQTLQEGRMATPDELNNDLQGVWKNNVGFGLNLSVKMITNALQKATQ